ncbi:MAG: carboxylating nicotinate-nucleotide diphosphorylase [Gemmatimonadetes bacterium]|nr:carboxylating nicotinate-nucleotide diphosphorylase [Gemmatimonadota bacterium]
MRPLVFPLDETAVESLVAEALAEDAAARDITTIATVPPGRRARANIVAREPGVIAGAVLATTAFRLLDRDVAIRVDRHDGEVVAAGETVMHLSGQTRGILSAERTALNFLQRMSGIASLTAKFVAAVQGTRAKIVDTRKTTPGRRLLEKYAVRCGGGANHRMDLAAAVLIKDNHLAAVGGDVAEAVRRVREHADSGIMVQVECDTLDQLREAVRAHADSVLLDNMSLENLRQAVSLAATFGSRVITEASGGVTLASVAAIAATGVDRISVGALTHSPPALDLALDFE